MNFDMHIGPHAVLPREISWTIRGEAPPRRTIVFEFRNQRFTTISDARGGWRMRVGPFSAGGPDVLRLHIEGSPSREAPDILVGDLWVCSGQSNMEMALKHAAGADAAIAGADEPLLRFLTVPRRVALRPQDNIGNARWLRCTPDNAAPFSALAFYTGRRLTEWLKIPIGLIQAAVGATPAEAWMAPQALHSDTRFQGILDRWQACREAGPQGPVQYAEKFRQWDLLTDQAEREGRPLPGAQPVFIGSGHAWTPSGLWHGMIAPLLTIPIRGVLWYQGAATPERAYQYRSLFQTLIRDWRRAWKQGDLPFIYAQEANFGPRRSDPGEHSWAELREAQAMALAEANTAMAVAIDLGEATDIHPKRKEPLGERMARAVMATAYGHTVPWSGPVMADMRIEGRCVRLRFGHCGDGLGTSDGRPPTGFALSPGADSFRQGNRGFKWARARIEGPDTILLETDGIDRPAAVRYAWAQNPDCNLTDSAGLPAAPFRSDDWPGITG